jgi:hypothetical protein
MGTCNEKYLVEFTYSKSMTLPQEKSEIKQEHLVIFEVFMAVTMKNAIFWDIKPHFVLHRRHTTSPLQSPAS